jgi:diacylglycerol kinase (ATP)
MRARSIAESFVFAGRGLVYILRRHQHARIQLLLGALVLFLGAVAGASALQMVALTCVVALVLIAEALNSAVEAVVNLSAPTYNPVARAAKDAAGAAVMVACAAAVVTGLLVFAQAGRVRWLLGGTIAQRLEYAQVALVGLVVVAALVAVAKATGGRGTLMRGGAVSLHSGAACFLAAAAWYMGGTVASALAAAMLAVLVCQSRVQGGIHSAREVIAGAALALVVALGLFSLVR